MTVKRVHYLQHVPFEGLGSMENWFSESDYQITRTLFTETSDLPDPSEIDILVVMGGPMSVNDEEEFPWLSKEMAFVSRVIDAELPVLGVCLGAQLIAKVLGSHIYPNGEKEIGWFPVFGKDSTSNAAFSFPDEIKVFHWHGETFDLPEGASLLASSDVCKNQAFLYRDRVMGLQFHLETTPQSALAIVNNCRNEIVSGRCIQSESEILGGTEEDYLLINTLMEKILTYLSRA